MIIEAQQNIEVHQTIPHLDRQVAHLKKCIRDPMIWFETQCFTQDQHRLDLRKRRFPKYSEQRYLYRCIEAIHTKRRICFIKSRQMMLSWVVVCYCLWATMFHRNVFTFFVSKKLGDASKLVKRAKFVYNAMEFQPEVLGLVHTIARKKGDLGTTSTFPFYPPAAEFKKGARGEMSKLEALSADPEAIRMETATLCVFDEIGFQPEAQACCEAIRPALGDFGTLIAVSTPNGKNYLYKIAFDCEDEEVVV